MQNLDEIRYPIGKYQKPETIENHHLNTWIETLEQLPARLREACSGLNEAQINTPYRPEGWTVGQVVHHIADSHINAYVRFKLTLTEDQPTIKPYKEALWADLEDSKITPIEVSLNLIESLHRRWVNLLQAMSESDFSKKYIHPEYGKTFSLDEVLGLYAWHSSHRLEHILGLKKRNQW